MPDAGGNIKGIALTGKAGETLDRIFPKYDCEHCGDTGLVRCYGAEDYGVSFESEACEHCPAGKEFVEPEYDCEGCFEAVATESINGMPVCEDCWERGMNLD